MMESIMKPALLPPGWENKLEPKTGKSFYVNHFTHNATLEDPRLKQITEELRQLPAQIHKKERNTSRHFPLMGASVIQSGNQPSMMDSLNRIRSMFPTVPETHIKALLLKYHLREAVVISALQVEKHPVATPGPFTPPPGRPQARSPLSPLARRPQPKPHSPKMKLRYLKSVFPIVEETLLLDTLCSSDNNVTFATQRLIRMGFDKKDTPIPPRVCLKKQDKPEEEKKPEPPPPPKIITDEEKHEMKNRLCQNYKDIPERVITLALDSADYNEKTAETILSFTLKEKSELKSESSQGITESQQVIVGEGETEVDAPTEYTNPKSPLPPPNHKCKTCADSHLFQSSFVSQAKGPNSKLMKGPNTALLLEDYVPWVGSRKGLAKGPNKNLVEGSKGAIGPDLSLRKGPQTSLVRGISRSSPYISRGN